MDISRKEATDSLNQIQTVVNHTQKAITSDCISPLLILWGVIFIAAYLGTHFFAAWAFHIWMVLDAIGVIGTFLICWQQFRSGSPTKVPPAEKMGWRMFWFWTLLFVYIFIWLNLMAPVKAVQMNAFMVTAIMFASVAKGLWLRSSFMVWFGLAVTAMTLFGFYLVPRSYYCLWMAVMAGGAFLASGLYLRLRWR
ncbi:MAG: hypothetical protein ACYTEQ_10860 [Planctomycetota bacterium]|jgi:hypothetical protein